MDDCIERARDITDGGARYDFTSISLRGLATVVDSLLGIETLVYEREEMSLTDLVAVLLEDFDGQESLRQRLARSAPKFGAGSERADGLARDVVAWVHELLESRRNVRGGRYRACYYSYGNHVVDGLFLDATPDGRRRGEPISNGVSPSNLASPDAGPTAPLGAAAGLPPRQVSSGVSLNMRFHPRMLATDHGLDTFARLVLAYFDLGGMHLQPNVVSTELLREAQQHPERHPDLVVKVAGYSAYFADLGRTIQEDIIARCEFGS
jgi:formate C-acetyltransferase